MNRLTKIIILLFLVCTAASSAVLFEVKNNDGSVIVEVSDDGVRFFNPAIAEKKDTIMIIAATSIKANATLQRDFDIADMGSTEKGRASGKSVMKMSVKDGYGVGGDSAVVFYKPKNAFRTNTIIQDETLVGDGSFAAGYLNEASGKHSSAFGSNSKAKGISSIVLGTNCIALGANSVAMGDETQATGDGSIAAGYLSTSSGLYTTSFGRNTLASSTGATAFGANTRATGKYSFAAGGESVAQSLISFVCGQYNNIEGNSNSWVDIDPLFVVGNGQNDAARSNAFEVKKNGNTYIPSLYNTTSTNAKKTVLVDNQGKLCVMSAKDNSAELNELKSENSDLKARVAKLEALMEQMLNK